MLLDDYDFTDKTIYAIVVTVISGLLLFAAVTITYSMRASGAVDHCFIQQDESGLVYRLWGHRAWSHDTKMGSFRSADEAVELARRIGCPLVEAR